MYEQFTTALLQGCNTNKACIGFITTVSVFCHFNLLLELLSFIFSVMAEQLVQ
jgi:hypothetical protein